MNHLKFWKEKLAAENELCDIFDECSETKLLWNQSQENKKKKTR